MPDDEQNVPGSNPSPNLNATNMDTDASSTPGEEENQGNLDEDDLENEEFYEEDQEEVFPDESDELPETRYQVGNEGISAVGDYAHITINNYIQIVRESRQRSFGEDGNGVKDDVFGGKDELIGQALTFVRQSGTFPVNPVNKTEAPDAQLPADEEQFATWYYKLDEYTQCYVQAAAILHGAPAHEVSRRADRLYMLLIEREEQPNGAPPMKAQHEPPRFPLRNRSSRELQAKTHTITQRIEGVERLFWRDVDIYGISSFGLRLLDFLSGEFMSRGARGQDFREKLQEWSQEPYQETSWRCSRALGVFLWHQNVGELRRTAIDWARNRSLRGWRRTAMLLDGAYEIESIKHPEKAGNARTSPELQLLNEWVRRSQKMQRVTDANMGCAAAHTYGLIGKRKPEVALRDLDELLQFPSSRPIFDTNVLFAAVVSAYVSLSWSGHIGSVFTHLALVAEQSILQHALPHRMSERYTYRRQCEVKLQVTLETFFLIIADSLSEASLATSIAYSNPLPDQPSLPDPLGRDVVLAGLLTEDGYGWRKQVTTLLSAAIIERRNRSSAFDMIQRWAETVLNIQEEQSEEAQQIAISFKYFMVNLGKTIDLWCLDLNKRQGRPHTASIIYRNRLEQWHKRGRTLGQLSQDVLYQLNG